MKQPPAYTSLLLGELMATLETILIYCPNLEVKREAKKRLEVLKEKYSGLIVQPLVSPT